MALAKAECQKSARKRVSFVGSASDGCFSIDLNAKELARDVVNRPSPLSKSIASC